MLHYRGDTDLTGVSVTPEAFKALYDAADTEFARLYPNRSPSTYTAIREHAKIMRRLSAVRP